MKRKQTVKESEMKNEEKDRDVVNIIMLHRHQQKQDTALMKHNKCNTHHVHLEISAEGTFQND